MKQLPLLLLFAFASLCPASTLEWMDSFADAKKRAAEEGKLVLAIFYGSEFTRNFANVRKEVMDSEAFCEYARDKFVCVEKYEQKDRATYAEAILKYRELSRQYNVKKWPTVFVATPEGIPTGGVAGAQRYEIVTPDRQVFRALTDEERLNIVLTALDNAILVAEKLRAAEAMPVEEDRLRALSATYYRLPQNFAPRIVFAKHVADQDPENKTGLRDEYLDQRQMEEWGEIGRYGMDSATTLRKMGEMIAVARPANRLTMLRGRYNMQSNHLNSAEDIAACTEAMEAYAAEWEKTEPEKAAELRREHAELYGSDPAEGFRRLQERREAAKKARERQQQEEAENRKKVRRAIWAPNGGGSFFTK